MFVTRVKRRVPLVEQKLLTLIVHPSLPLFYWVRIARSLVFCVMFCWSLFDLLFFFFYYILFHFFPTGNDMFHAVEDIKNEISIPVFLMGTLNIPAEYKSWSQLMLMASSAEISRCVRAGLKLLMPCCYIYTSGTTG